MVEVTNNNGACGLESSITVDHTLVEILKNPQNKESINNLLKDLKFAHRIEEKDGKFISIARFDVPNRFNAVNASKELEAQHQEFLEQLLQMRYKLHNDEAEPDSEEEEFLDYALLCALKDIIGEFGVIVIAVPK